MVCLTPNTVIFPLYQIASLMDGSSRVGAGSPIRLRAPLRERLALLHQSRHLLRARTASLPLDCELPRSGGCAPPIILGPSEGRTCVSPIRLGISWYRVVSFSSDWDLPKGRGASEVPQCLCRCLPPHPTRSLKSPLPVTSLTLVMSCAGLSLSLSRSCQQASKPQYTPGIN